MLVRGIVLGGLSASGLSLLMVGAVALIAPPPGSDAPERSAPPAAPQAASPGAAPNAVPAAPASEPDDQRTAATDSAPATGIELPAGSQFGRGTPQTLATPGTPEAGPSRNIASTPPPAPEAAPQSFAPATESADAPDIVVSLAPVQGPGDLAADPEAPAPVVEGAPTTFRSTGIGEEAVDSAPTGEDRPVVVETPGGSLEVTAVTDDQAPPLRRPGGAPDGEAPVTAATTPAAPVAPTAGEEEEEVQIARADLAPAPASERPAAPQLAETEENARATTAPAAPAAPVDAQTSAPTVQGAVEAPAAPSAPARAGDQPLAETTPPAAVEAEADDSPQPAPQLAEAAPTAPVSPESDPDTADERAPDLTQTDAVQTLSPVAELETTTPDAGLVADAPSPLPQTGLVDSPRGLEVPTIALAATPEASETEDVALAAPGALATPARAEDQPVTGTAATPTPAPARPVAEAPEQAQTPSPEPVPQTDDTTETAQLIRPVPEAEVVAPPRREEIGPEPAPIVPRVVTPGQPRRIQLNSEVTAAPSEAQTNDTAVKGTTPDGRAITENAAPFQTSGGTPLFTVVLIDDGRGVSPDNLAAIDFPVTFALDALDPQAATRAAAYRAAGQEVVLLAEGLPAQGTPQDFEIALAGALQALPQAVAVLDTPDRRMARNRQSLPALADTGHGLVTHPVGLGSAVTEARRAGVPAAQFYRLLDEDDERATVITRYLDRATFEAVQEGSTIVVGRARPETITALYSWRLGDRSESVELAPLSAVLLAQE